MSNYLILAEPVRLDLLQKWKQGKSWPAMRVGSQFVRSIFFNDSNGDPVDLTGWGCRTSVREEYGDAAPTLLLSTSNSGHELTDEGEIKFIISDEDTAAVSAGDSTRYPRVKRYIYDTELVTPDNEAFALLHGIWEVVAEVTTETDT